jgi:2-hydroxychromene-2-carboxylate isomerase
MSKTIDYYMSISSPWSYLGHERFVALAKKHSADVNLRVVDLAKVFPVSGGLPLPKRAPQRQAYRMFELKRWKAHLAIAFNPVPKFFPVKGDPAARMVIAALPQGSERALALAGAYMRAAWAEERDVGDADTLEKVAAAQGFDGAKLLALSNAPATQQRYDEFTQHAVDQQVFGAPWYVYQGEPFWGQDRLSFLEKALAG